VVVHLWKHYLQASYKLIPDTVDGDDIPRVVWSAYPEFTLACLIHEYDMASIYLWPCGHNSIPCILIGFA
jgi:hypothetical protein